MTKRRTSTAKPSFDPQSLDSTLARLSEKMDNHHTYTREQFAAAAIERAEIRVEVKKTNGRVTALEFFRAAIRTQAGTISAIVSSVVVLIGLLIAWFKS